MNRRRVCIYIYIGHLTKYWIIIKGKLVEKCILYYGVVLNIFIKNFIKAISRAEIRLNVLVVYLSAELKTGIISKIRYITYAHINVCLTHNCVDV